MIGVDTKTRMSGIKWQMMEKIKTSFQLCLSKVKKEPNNLRERSTTQMNAEPKALLRNIYVNALSGGIRNFEIKNTGLNNATAKNTNKYVLTLNRGISTQE